MDLTTISMVRSPGAARRGAGVLPLSLPRDGETPVQLRAARDGEPQTPGELVFALIDHLDQWLAPYGDRPPAQDFAQWRRDHLRPPITDAVLGAAHSELSRQIVDAVPDWPTVRLLTRKVLLLALLDRREAPESALASAGASTDFVYDRLRRRTPLFPEGVDVPIPAPKVLLVRDAKVSDLFVVRSEWSCYQAGEIAAVTNVLAHESYSTTTKLTDERETTVTTETERTESTEQTDEDRSQTELSREVNREQQLQVNAEGSVNLSGQYGLTKFAAHAGVGVNASLSESTRQASRVARDVLSRAVTRVESRTRDQRVQRSLTRSVDRTSHGIENTTADHLRGVYRWVDRIDRYQVFRYPDRLQLEFEIPEPAEYLRYRLRRPRAAGAGDIGPPPAFTVSADQISPAGYAALALRYRAGTIPAPPDPVVSVTTGTNLGTTTEQDTSQETWSAPTMDKELNVPVPAGYVAVGADIAATAMPVRAKWRVEWQRLAPDRDGKTAFEGFHQITLGVVAGGTRLLQQKGAYVPFERFTVQMSKEIGQDGRPSTYFGDAVLATPSPAAAATSITFKQPVVDKVTLAVSVAGASSAAVSAEIRCRLRAEALEEWRNNVYDLLLDAWRSWDREWRLQEQQRQPLGPQLTWVDATSPARNAQMIVEELKRQVVTWLLDDDSFAGRDAMQPPSSRRWQRYDIDAARTTAPTIQFLEQALEWNNLTYVPYPYYWAREKQWDELTAIEGADPNFAAFLRAGSARVVVPAQPGFELAMLHWLIYQQPFFGDPMPLPDEDLYVCVAAEIRDLTGAPDDGEPGDCWENRLPTTLMWLDEQDSLPRNDRRRLGRPPHEPAAPYCTATGDSSGSSAGSTRRCGWWDALFGR